MALCCCLARSFRLTAQTRHRSLSCISVDNPYSGEIVTEVPLMNDNEIDALIARSSIAQREWSNTSLDGRLAVCERFSRELEKMGGQIALDITSQMGKPLSAAKGEVATTLFRNKTFMELAPAALADEPLPAAPGLDRTITRVPVGVVLSLAPWNYPMMTAVNSVVPAVLAGNSVVLKHSPRTPLCAEHFVSAFRAAGAPEGLVSALNCSNEGVATAIQNEKVGFVAFTGSVAGGRAVYSTVANNRFIDATLELGGKDPLYVAPDADLEAAVDGIVDGSLFNAGQSCCAVERVYVHEALLTQVEEAVYAAAADYRIGDPTDEDTDLGPMALPEAPAFLSAQVTDAVSRGARLLLGGVPRSDAHGKGRFFAPTVLMGTDHSMEVMRRETFGPVIAIQSVADDDEAVALMNDSSFGLTASVYTTDKERAASLAARLSAGTVFANRCDFVDPLQPWAGVRDSGKGFSCSRHSFAAFTQMKSLHFKGL